MNPVVSHLSVFVTVRTQAILFNATESMLTEYIIPMAQKLKNRAVEIRKKEEAYCVEKRNNSENASDLEEELTEVSTFPLSLNCCL